MPCIANECRSGSIRPCPAPEVCYPDLHRVTMAAEPCTEIGAEQAPANRKAGMPLPKLSSAGWFWIAYVLGIASALLLPHFTT